MIAEFEGLNEQEQQLVMRAPVLVALLIAGADEKIDKAEKRRAAELIRLKHTTGREVLHAFYEEVGQDFEQKLEDEIGGRPKMSQERNQQICEELSKLNEVLPKMPYRFSNALYSSMKDLAKKIAEASGGVLGFMPIGYEESKLIGLTMLEAPKEG